MAELLGSEHLRQSDDGLSPADGRMALDRLQCPRCSAPLEDPGQCGECGRDFPRCGDQPVLIDFDRSLFDEADYRADRPVPAMPTASRLGTALARLTYGRSRPTSKSVETFIAELNKRDLKRILLIGAGTVGEGMAGLYEDPALELIGTDIYPSHHTRLVCDAHQLPFQDGTFDGVVVQAVLEHVLVPETVVAEIHRVLRPGGLVYAETPFLQAVHMGANDFTRFTFSGHRWLFRRFDQIDAGVSLGAGITLLWSIREAWKVLGTGERLANLLTAPFFWVRWIERRNDRPAAHDNASSCYFIGARSESSLHPRDMLGYYRSEQRSSG